MKPDTTTATATGTRYSVTVDIGHGIETIPVPGRLIRPGLAITTWLDEHGQISHAPAQFVFTHLPSGRYIGDPLCQSCIQISESRVLATHVDWTQDQTTLRADPAVLAMHNWLTNVADFCLTLCPSATIRTRR